MVSVVIFWCGKSFFFVKCVCITCIGLQKMVPFLLGLNLLFTELMENTFTVSLKKMKTMENVNAEEKKKSSPGNHFHFQWKMLCKHTLAVECLADTRLM